MYDYIFVTVVNISNILLQPVEYLKGVGPQRADLLKKELGIFTYADLLYHFPFRHIDKSRITRISELGTMPEFVQVRGRLLQVEITGEKSSKRLVARLRDETGTLELTWFRSITWIERSLKPGEIYTVFGRIGFFLGRPQMVHPEMELYQQALDETRPALEPVYPSTEKLRARNLNGRQIGRITRVLVSRLSPADLPENLPDIIIKKYRLCSRFDAFTKVHFPGDMADHGQAVRRLKFEELFFSQLRLSMVRSERHRRSSGVVFARVGELFNSFYSGHLPFELTDAQKQVIREIRADTASGHQMNRLLQGDVGSGKTIVALLVMLIAIDNDYQVCLMAPTEILAQQHFHHLCEMLTGIPLNIGLLTGSTVAAERRQILAALEDGSLPLLIGTHALIEESVKFKRLGLAVIDEQHRFGVAQRAELWKKAVVPPHMLVMTATPIPRTLAMTAYGDLDYSIMNQLPPGRQPVTTIHRYDRHRARVMDFIREQIDAGRQAYIIFPLIEESASLDYENLMSGYENVKAFFPEPRYWVSMVHGRQPTEQKEVNMQRFVRGDTQIMVSTTVIEVGVNIPNATVMVIESAEKFGLSQLHQLRGRVGRGSEKSYCILLTSEKLGNDARQRISIMTSTSNGFEIAEKDLELRGPGDIEGTRQSGLVNFRMADIVKDRQILEEASKTAGEIIDADPELKAAENLQLREYLESLKGKTPWSRIS